MNKKIFLLITNIVLLLSFITLVLTVVLMEFTPYAFIKEIHENAGIVFAIAALIHIYLNWAWIRTNLIDRPKL